MRNLKITGGIDVGPPKRWNPAKDGECLSLSVLHYEGITPRTSSRTTAWSFSDAELNALANGGTFFQSLRLPFVPVMGLWVQDAAGKVVGELRAAAAPGEPEDAGVRPENSEVERQRADRAVMVAGHLRAGIIAIGRELDKALAIVRDTPAADWPALDNAGALARLAELARTITEAPPPAPDVVKAPVYSLDDLVRGDAKFTPNPTGPAFISTDRALTPSDLSFLAKTFAIPIDKIRGWSGMRPLSGKSVDRVIWDENGPPPIVPVFTGVDLAAPDKSDMTATTSASVEGRTSAFFTVTEKGENTAIVALARPEPTPDASAVLDYVDTFAGQEDEAGQVCEFVQLAAKYIFEQRPADDWLANDTLSGFYSWWQDERETFPRG